MKRFALMFLALLLPCLAVALPEPQPVPGGVVHVDLAADSEKRPEARYRDQAVMVVAEEGRWKAIVGIPLTADAGEETLLVRGENGEREIRFEVKPHAYEEQHITLQNRRMVNPDPLDLERIGRERTRQNASWQSWRFVAEPAASFILPVDGPQSSAFGLQRFFNGEPRAPHSGIDLAAPEGTPILAPERAIVLDTGDFFFNGKTVFLDHGQGLVSMYCHMSEIDVKPGDIIEQGTVIGKVGATGRVTGPHLHWSVALNDVRVNPWLFIKEKTATE